MARISNIIYCMNTMNQQNDGNLNANSIISAITPDYVPGAFSFSVIVIILDIETTAHKLDLQFIAPNGEVVVDMPDVPIPPNMEPGNLPKEYNGVNISMDWQNIVFKQSGLYNLKIFFDGEDLGLHPILVKGKNEQ